MTPIDYNIDMFQGSTFKLDLELEDGNGAAINLTGATIRGKMRRTASATIVEATFTCTIVSAVGGTATVGLTAAQTAAIAADPSQKATREITNFAYDIEYEDSGGIVDRILQGIVNFYPEVTK